MESSTKTRWLTVMICNGDRLILISKDGRIDDVIAIAETNSKQDLNNMRVKEVNYQ